MTAEAGTAGGEPPAGTAAVAKPSRERVLSRGEGADGAFLRLYGLVRLLRSPEGCPWDGRQTPESMRSFLLEEAYEVADAIGQGDAAHVREELGDLLFNIVLIACIYEQEENFTVAELCNDVVDKLVRRHPHVFAGESRNEDAISDRWEQIKAGVEHRAELRRNGSVLDDVPAGFPPLLKAYKYLKKAAKLHFDWPDIASAKAKVREEYAEVEDAAAAGEDAHLEEEIGDLLLSVANLSRCYGVDPSVALSRANGKFYRRFSYVERQMKERGIAMDGEHLQDMERLWTEAKDSEKIIGHR